ncbi:hypothetical protein HY620_03370 [Candidatus Uhrbacteria bacterium]|nr:hypothetical protein [Candidatus Uhrbacteria bacterium]
MQKVTDGYVLHFINPGGRYDYPLDASNIICVHRNKERAWHLLFGNRTVPAVIDYIKRYLAVNSISQFLRDFPVSIPHTMREKLLKAESLNSTLTLFNAARGKAIARAFDEFTGFYSRRGTHESEDPARPSSHHIYPSSRWIKGNPDHRSNILYLSLDKHQALHELFGNMKPDEMIGHVCSVWAHSNISVAP